MATAASFAGSASSLISVRLEELSARFTEAYEAGAASGRALVQLLQSTLESREKEIGRLHGEIKELHDKIRSLSDVSLKLRELDVLREVQIRRLENQSEREARLTKMLEKPVNHFLQGAIGGGAGTDATTDETAQRATRARIALGRLFQERPDLCAQAQAHLGADWMSLVDFVAG